MSLLKEEIEHHLEDLPNPGRVAGGAKIFLLTTTPPTSARELNLLCQQPEL